MLFNPASNEWVGIDLPLMMVPTTSSQLRATVSFPDVPVGTTVTYPELHYIVEGPSIADNLRLINANASLGGLLTIPANATKLKVRLIYPAGMVSNASIASGVTGRALLQLNGSNFDIPSLRDRVFQLKLNSGQHLSNMFIGTALGSLSPAGPLDYYTLSPRYYWKHGTGVNTGFTYFWTRLQFERVVSRETSLFAGAVYTRTNLRSSTAYQSANMGTIWSQLGHNFSIGGEGDALVTLAMHCFNESNTLLSSERKDSGLTIAKNTKYVLLNSRFYTSELGTFINDTITNNQTIRSYLRLTFDNNRVETGIQQRTKETRTYRMPVDVYSSAIFNGEALSIASWAARTSTLEGGING